VFSNGGAPVNVDKRLIIIGVRTGVDARTRTGPESVITVPMLINADNVQVSGLTINCGACGGAGAGITTSRSSSGYRILNNIITGNPVGVVFDSNGTTQSLLRFNAIADNNASGTPSGLGVNSTSLTNALIEDNAFAGNLTAQIKVAGVSAPATVGIVRNSFS